MPEIPFGRRTAGCVEKEERIFPFFIACERGPLQLFGVRYRRQREGCPPAALPEKEKQRLT
jgi:hypothetical protein